MLKIRQSGDRLIFNKGIPIRVRWHLYIETAPWPHFYQTRSAWSMDQGSNEYHSPVNNFAPTVTKFCVMWEGQALPHDPKFGNCRDKIVDSRSFLSWSLIHESSWSGLIKVGPGFCRKITAAWPMASLSYWIGTVLNVSPQQQVIHVFVD